MILIKTINAEILRVHCSDFKRNAVQLAEGP